MQAVFKKQPGVRNLFGDDTSAAGKVMSEAVGMIEADVVVGVDAQSDFGAADGVQIIETADFGISAAAVNGAVRHLGDSADNVITHLFAGIAFGVVNNEARPEDIFFPFVFDFVSMVGIGVAHIGDKDTLRHTGIFIFLERLTIVCGCHYVELFGDIDSFTPQRRPEVAIDADKDGSGRCCPHSNNGIGVEHSRETDKKILNPIDAHYLKKYAKNIIYDFDDAVLFDNKHPEKPHHKRQTSFKRTVALAGLVIAGNSFLAAQARKFNSNVEILPTGLDTAAYHISKPPEDGIVRLVWIGSRPTLPHLKAISPALEIIGVRFNNVVLKIISDVFFNLKKIKVEKRKWSLETEAVELAGSDIGLAPLIDNNFTRGKCGFKILQYAAAGLPAIASPVGVNSEIITHGSNGYLAATDNDWIDCISSLIQNSALRRQMGDKARQSVQKFDTKLLACRLAELIRSVTS